jgi:lipoprotein-anchoring transpeptidase ErfK/SrfK
VRWGLPPLVLVLVVLVAPTAHAELAIGRGCDSEVHSVGTRTVGWAVYAKHPLRAFTRPGGQPLERFPRRNQNGVTSVFGVLGVVNGADCEPVWYRVQLPTRPNGATGFVRADAVVLYPVRTRIEVDLTDRRLTFFRQGRRVLSAPVAIGAPPTPTPTGRYYVNQRLRALDPSGPFGPAAIGISAFSPVLTHWAQGGPIAVHGTDYPASVGEAVSHGCIRVRNDVLRTLFRLTETGAPVVIRA